MRSVMLATAILATGIATAAEARPDSRNMSCHQARALVARHGSVVMSTGRHTYERLVASRAFCAVGEVLQRYWVPTRDGRCFAGYRCKTYSRDDSLLWRRD